MANPRSNLNHAYRSEVEPTLDSNSPLAFTTAPYASSMSLPSGATNRRALPNFDFHKDVASTPNSSNIQSAAQRREDAKARRRVPASQRKRTKLSCDACKTKRCKCLRIGPAPDSDLAQDGNLVSCKNCADAGIECITKLPRKQRIYGSVEQLNRRYRALDALVSGLLPDLPSDAKPEELIEYGRQHGVVMPDFVTEVERLKSPTSSSLNMRSPISPLNASRRIGDDSHELGNNHNCLSRDASGHTCYIGPWGSLGCLTRVHNLLVRGPNASTEPDASRHGQRLASKSVTDSIASSFGETLTDIVLSAPQAPINDSIDTDDSPFWVALSKIKLPDRELADICVNAFFTNVHPDFMLFHQPSFQQDYEDLWDRSEGRLRVSHPEAEKHVSVGWLCCLYLVFILGSRSLPQNPSALEFQRAWYESIKELLSLLIMPTLPNVCALMLLALYYQGTNDLTKSWIYLGAASRLAVALGMHRECANEGMGLIITEIRKRVWWTLYDYEQHLCCSLGRPSSIEDIAVDVDTPDEGKLQCVPALPREQLAAWVQLIRMQATIRREIHVSKLSAIDAIPQAVQFLHQLGAWRRDLPAALLPPSRGLLPADPQKWRRIMLFHVQYQKVVNLLTRIFLLHEIEVIAQGESLGQHAFMIVSLSKVCITSAMRCAQLLLELGRVGKFNGVTALDTYYAYLCSAQLCLRLLQLSYTHSESHKLRVEARELQLEGSLDVELKALIAQMKLAEQYSSQELTEIIRQVHDLLQTVPMSGFSAQCEAISSEFAKVVGAVDEKPESTLFGGRTGQDMHNLSQRMNESPHSLQSMVLPNPSLFSSPMPPAVMDALGKLRQPFQRISTTMGVASSAATNSAYSRIRSPDFTEGTHAMREPQIQWDVIQPLQEWSDRNRLLTGMAADPFSEDDHQCDLTHPHL